MDRKIVVGDLIFEFNQDLNEPVSSEVMNDLDTVPSGYVLFKGCVVISGTSS